MIVAQWLAVTPPSYGPRHRPSGVDGYGWIMPASWIAFARPTRPSPVTTTLPERLSIEGE